MICFITDTMTDMTDEVDILNTSFRLEPLRIESLEGRLIAEIDAPHSGWTHEALIAAAERLEKATKSGAEAYLGVMWVGGTEV